MTSLRNMPLVVAEQAIKDAGLDSFAYDHDRVGVIWGSGIGGLILF
jgi:3-oxoacyl-[acyl-carrier-protein] synthase II